MKIHRRRFRSPTHYKFAHYRTGEDGHQYLIWANNVGDIPIGEIRRHTSDDHAVLQDRLWLPNAMVDEGEAIMVDCVFRNANCPATTYFRLYTAAPVETSTLTSISANEETGAGYAAISLARGTTDWPTLAGSQVTSATKTFNATGTWGALTHLILATTSDNTGKLMAFVALSATRSLISGDSLNVDMSVDAE